MTMRVTDAAADFLAAGRGGARITRLKLHCQQAHGELTAVAGDLMVLAQKDPPAYRALADQASTIRLELSGLVAALEDLRGRYAERLDRATAALLEAARAEDAALTAEEGT